MTALMYHDVVDAGAEDTSGFPGRDAALYKVTPELFASHLDAIAQPRTIEPALPHQPNLSVLRDPHDRSVSPDPPDRSALTAARDVRTPVITFDDGGVSAMRAADLLESHHLVGHFFVTSNYLGARGFLTGRDIRELAARGHIIGSHSCSHPLRMGHCPWTQLRDEWTLSCAILGEVLGEPVDVASVPGGDFAPQVAESAARAGITRLFTSEPTSESRRAFGLTLIGRYTIQRSTAADTVAALAAGDWLPRARQSVLWNAKKVTKRLGGQRYLQLRKLLLGHGNDVQWGDQR
jgi:peptidoglycan/xylan/chitin deacetylase (PgdA/CDA1 family)